MIKPESNSNMIFARALHLRIIDGKWQNNVLVACHQASPCGDIVLEPFLHFVCSHLQEVKKCCLLQGKSWIHLHPQFLHISSYYFRLNKETRYVQYCHCCCIGLYFSANMCTEDSLHTLVLTLNWLSSSGTGKIWICAKFCFFFFFKNFVRRSLQ